MIKVPGGRKTKSMADETYLISHRLMNRGRTIFESSALETWSAALHSKSFFIKTIPKFYKDVTDVTSICFSDNVLMFLEKHTDVTSVR